MIFVVGSVAGIAVWLDAGHHPVRHQPVSSGHTDEKEN